MNTRYDFSVERRVTKCYRQYKDSHKAIREVKCMEQMYPAVFCDIQPEDLFAGRIQMSLIGFSPEPGGLGYYCDEPAVRRRLEEGGYPESLRAEMEEILAFWKQENTAAKVRAGLSSGGGGSPAQR